DPLLALGWAAATTSPSKLAPGIVILPQRNPVVLAKQLASLDVLSIGRLLLGIGVRYLEPEFAAIGANFAERGAVTDEFLAAMRSLWEDEHPAYHGRFAEFSRVDAHPRPLRPSPRPALTASSSPRRSPVTHGRPSNSHSRPSVRCSGRCADERATDRRRRRAGWELTSTITGGPVHRPNGER
ncbi:MAG: LLM class flavin-dependent oxidoreductase, partial [Actinomycetota bacterium]|nr:LLM class flavin-dependent oxidoreductase [Actinomycetota bacterium]